MDTVVWICITKMTFGLAFFHVLWELGEELTIGGGSGWGAHVHHGWFMSMYGKTHDSIVKWLASN